MPLGCAVILAYACLSAPYDRVANLRASYAITDLMKGESIGVAQAAEVKALGVRVDVYKTDMLEPRQTDGLARACDQGICLLYAKTCAKDGLTCEWDWGLDPGANDKPFYADMIVITAATPTAMAKAARAVAIQPTAHGSVRLAAMDKPSAFAFFPPCVGQRTQGCNYQLVGRIPFAARPRR